MKAKICVLLVPFLMGCAAATEVATTVGVETGVISQTQKESIDKTAGKAETAARPITEAEEYYIGRGVAARILSQYKLYNHPDAIRYINRVGQTLALNSSRPYTYGRYHFAILDTEEMNAFACPGGIIFITKGMLRLSQNEDQLAAVLAHEIGHVTQKHGLKSISQARWAEVVTTLGSEAARSYTGAELDSLVHLFEGTIDDVFRTLVVNGYGRTAEHEADRLAIGSLHTSGYSPREFVRLLERMGKAQGPKPSGILATHPGLDDRLERAKRDPRLGEGTPVAAERAARFARVAGCW